MEQRVPAEQRDPVELLAQVATKDRQEHRVQVAFRVLKVLPDPPERQGRPESLDQVELPVHRGQQVPVVSKDRVALPVRKESKDQVGHQDLKESKAPKGRAEQVDHKA